MKFSEMGYQRPDMAKIEKCADEISSLIESAGSAADAEKAYMDWDRIERSFSTALNICYIRHSINTEDEFYSKENDFFDDNSPKFTECAQKVAKAITLSPFRKELEESLSRVFFINNELLLKGFCTENIPLMQEENRLVSEYEKLIASAQIEFEGKKFPSPHNADAYLTDLFKNYMEIPPVEKRQVHAVVIVPELK
jgi:oligoendopeptidase F